MSDAKTILVVDDEPDAIEFVTAVISRKKQKTKRRRKN